MIVKPYLYFPVLNSRSKEVSLTRGLDFVLDRIKRISDDLYFYRYSARLYSVVYGRSESCQESLEVIHYVQSFQGSFKGRSCFKASIKLARMAKKFFQISDLKGFLSSVEAGLALVKKGAQFALWLKKKNWISLCIRGRDLAHSCSKSVAVSRAFLGSYTVYQITTNEKVLYYREFLPWVIAALAFNDLAIAAIYLSGINMQPLVLPTLKMVACLGETSSRFFSSIKNSSEDFFPSKKGFSGAKFAI